MGFSMVLASEWDCDCDSGMEGMDEEGMKSPRARSRLRRRPFRAGRHPKGELEERAVTPPARLAFGWDVSPGD